MPKPLETHREPLNCGYKRCCPTFVRFEDGSVELTDDDAETGSVGTIKLRPESAKRLRELLAMEDAKTS